MSPTTSAKKPSKAPAKKASKAPATKAAKTPAAKKQAGAFTAEERAAMKERAKELKASGERADGEREVLAKIRGMKGLDRTLGEKVHALVTAAAPSLSPKTWYGMPAYARDGKIVCFFKNAQKFGARYATFEFNDQANLDDGDMWPIGFALTKIGPAEEARIVALVKKAVS